MIIKATSNSWRGITIELQLPPKVPVPEVLAFKEQGLELIQVDILAIHTS